MEPHRRNDIKWAPNFLGMTIYTEWFVGLHARRYFVQTSHKLDIYLMYGLHQQMKSKSGNQNLQ